MRVRRDELGELARGLTRGQKTVSSRYFYDERGSELFEAITRLPEYYLTRAERGLLKRIAPGLIGEVRPRALVEFGAGSARKTRILLDAMTEGGRTAVYVPVDVSEDFLFETASRLRQEYSALKVRPEVADMEHGLRCAVRPPTPCIYALLGSTVGNFTHEEAVRMIAGLSSGMRDGDVFLLGADLRPGPGKSLESLEAAYNDAAGVTVEFNRNLLRVLNARFGTDFDPSRFRHRAWYDAANTRIEMHLEALSAHAVALPGGPVISFREGETLRTEISCKYDRAAVSSLLRQAGLEMMRWWTDEGCRFALALGAVNSGGGSP